MKNPDKRFKIESHRLETFKSNHTELTNKPPDIFRYFELALDFPVKTIKFANPFFRVRRNGELFSGDGDKLSRYQ